MAARTIAFLLGCITFQQLSRVPTGGEWLLLGGVAAAALLLRRRFPVVAPLSLAVFFALGGFAWSGARAAVTLADALPTALEGRDLQVVGVIDDLPERGVEQTRFDLRPEAILRDGQPVAFHGRLRLGWYDKAPELHAGERWQLTVRLKQPHGMANPGGFDYEGWLFQRGIRATGYVREDAGNRLMEPHARFFVQQMRDDLRTRLDAALTGTPRSGVLVALAIGDGSRISDEEWDLFRATGITHLMAISGLHVGMVAALAAWGVRRAWRRPRLIHCLPAQKAAALAAVAAAAAYALLAGFSVPTQRTLIMIGAVVAALWLARVTRPTALLAVACWAVLLYDPLAVLAPGFWLSFGAVALILYTLGGRLEEEGMVRQWGRMQWALALGLAPLLLGFFGNASLVSPVANLVAVPWISLGVVPLTLVGSLLLYVWAPLGQWLLHLAEWLTAALWPLLEFLAREVPPLAWPQPPLWVLLCSLVGIALLLAPRGWPGRWLGLVWCVPLLFWPSPRPAAGEVWLHLLDVGQGLAAVVETQGHVLVFDTGPRFGPGFDTGEAVVEPFVRQRGWRRVDTLVISHGDGDHSGGVGSLLAALPVERLLAAAPSQISRFTAGRLPEGCHRGEQWAWDGVTFSFLHPEQESEENDGSCVLRVAGAGGAVLLTGDIERSAEEAMVRSGTPLQARVLVVPHHGSKSSSSDPFLDAVGPQAALFPVGYRNRYRFPNEAVVARYAARGVARHDTATEGALRVRLAADGGMEITGWRAETAKYWHHGTGR